MTSFMRSLIITQIFVRFSKFLILQNHESIFYKFDTEYFLHYSIFWVCVVNTKRVIGEDRSKIDQFHEIANQNFDFVAPQNQSINQPSPAETCWARLLGFFLLSLSKQVFTFLVIFLFQFLFLFPRSLSFPYNCRL